MHYQHVLLATDLSPQAIQVAKRAREIANDSNANLDVVHVIEHSPVAYGGEFSIPIDVNLEQTIEAQAREALVNLCAAIDINEDHQHLLEGSVKNNVTELANKLNSDIIVVGSHGHHGIDKLLGSRANAILHNAQCDVLAVRVFAA